MCSSFSRSPCQRNNNHTRRQGGAISTRSKGGGRGPAGDGVRTMSKRSTGMPVDDATTSATMSGVTALPSMLVASLAWRTGVLSHTHQVSTASLFFQPQSLPQSQPRSQPHSHSHSHPQPRGHNKTSNSTHLFSGFELPLQLRDGGVHQLASPGPLAAALSSFKPCACLFELQLTRRHPL